MDANSQHEPREARGLLKHYMKDLIYGANDGIITTFAIVTAVTGAALQPRIVLILGIANLLADGFSMGASNFLSIRSGGRDTTRRWAGVSRAVSDPSRGGHVHGVRSCRRDTVGDLCGGLGVGVFPGGRCTHAYGVIRCRRLSGNRGRGWLGQERLRDADGRCARRIRLVRCRGPRSATNAINPFA